MTFIWFQSSENVNGLSLFLYFFFLLMFHDFTASITMTRNANRAVINVIVIAEWTYPSF